MEASLSHVIGTVALILLTASAASYFAAAVYHIQTEILKQHLTEVANYILTSIIEITVLIRFTDILNNATIFKTLNLPTDISGYAYIVELKGESGEGAYLHLYISSRRDVEVSLKLPLKIAETNVKIFTVNDEAIILSARNGVIKPSGRVYGGGKNIVAWGWRENTTLIWAGIGTWDGGGGSARI
jgi:hypothetical protein